MTTTRHKIDATRSGCTNGMDWDVDYVITFDFLPGAPDTFEEPGYGPEAELVAITPDAGDHGAFTDLAQQHLKEWAADWLDEHIDEVCALVAADREPDPDYARDLKAEYDRERGR